MTPPRLHIPNLDDTIKRYVAGESAEKLSREIGVSRATLLRRMVEAGIAIRTHGESLTLSNKARRSSIDLSTAIVRYQAGEDMQSLCREFDVDRRYFTEVLIQAGFEPRSQRQSLSLRYVQMTKFERDAITQAAHNAKRGKPARMESLERRAITMESTLQLASRGDLVLAMWLAQKGLVDFTPQKAIGPYNVDIAIHEPAVAVEVCGDWHSQPLLISRQADPIQRRKYLFDCGWRLIEVRIDNEGGKRRFVRPAAADRIISLLQLASEDEAAWGQHCVIWGNGEDAPMFGHYSDHWS